jgi:hypothetical protein
MWKSICCEGEICRICGKPAAAKVEEVIQIDDPHVYRHPLTAYLCDEHFARVMGLAGVAAVEDGRHG